MNRLKDMYEEYIENLEKEGAMDEAIIYEDYAYMYSLYLKRYGFSPNSEKEINEALDEIDKLLNQNFEDIKEYKTYIEPMVFKHKSFNLREEIIKSNCDLQYFCVTSLENPREYIETYCGIVDIDLNKIISNNSSLSIKDGYKLVVYKIKNNFEDKYKVYACKEDEVTATLSEQNLIDTYFEGIDLDLNKVEESFMDVIEGDKSINSYMEAILLFNEIIELETGSLSDTIFYRESKQINKQLNNNLENPIFYEFNDKKIIKYYGYMKNEDIDEDTFSKNIVLFENDSYNLKLATIVE